MFQRPFSQRLATRLREPRRFLLIVTGPRQVGKSTAAQQALANLPIPHHYVGPNDITPRSPDGITWHWEGARHLLRDSGGPVVLAFDNVTTVPGWADTLCRLWDEDSAANRDIRVVTTAPPAPLTGPDLVSSLEGRFDILPMTPWSWRECQAAFDWNIDTYVFHGGFPAAARAAGNPEAWRTQILGSVIEPSITTDIPGTFRVRQPASLRRLFSMACASAGEEVSFERLMARLGDVGNTTTVARYLEVLGHAGLVSALPKYSPTIARQRRSKPKLAVHDPAFLSAVDGDSFEAARLDPRKWRRQVVAAVGAHLLNEATRSGGSVSFWRTRLHGEDVGVDFVLTQGDRVTAVAVGLEGSRAAEDGLDVFRQTFGPAVTTTLVGTDGASLEAFLGE